MKALRFHNDVPRIVATKLLGRLTKSAYTGALAPIRYEEIAEPELPASDWLRVRVATAGICGSDLKQVLVKGAIDNPLTALISFPHVLGHEAVGVVDEVGDSVDGLRPGDRVVLDPWLPCAPRGIDPSCAACARGDLTHCRNFDAGRLPPGIHLGNNAVVPGVFASRFVAHRSQCHRVPDEISDEAAVLADPFSVSLHSILRRPPSGGEPVLVYGLGTLGLCAVAGLRHLYPDVPVLAVARYEHQAELGLRFGAREVVRGKPREVIERVAALTGAKLLEPWHGDPWTFDGVEVVYDTVGSPSTLETALRLTRSRGAVVISGVEAARRFEWTPIYFKEVDVVGSNAFAFEDFRGRRRHAFEIYLDLCREGLDVTPIITHRFPLERWRDAFHALMHRARSGAVKVVLDPGDAPA